MATELMNHQIYGELLKNQSNTIKETRDHIQRMLAELEEKKELAASKRILLNTFKKDITESFTDCRSVVKKAFGAMNNYLKQQQEEMLRELETTAQFNLEALQNDAHSVDSTLLRIEQQLDEGRSLLREQDTFTFFAKGALYKQLPRVVVPSINPQFQDTFPDLTTLSIAPFQVPLQHAVPVDMRDFLTCGVNTRICGNVFHNGFRFQIQLKHDERYLSAYLCLRAWHDVATFLRVTVNFTLTMQDGPQLLHSATAKNTFEGPNDGWGWNKFLSLSKLQDCTEVLFFITFNETSIGFVQEERMIAEYDTPVDRLPPPQASPYAGSLHESSYIQ